MGSGDFPWFEPLLEACGFDSTEPGESWTATATDVPPLEESERRRILEKYGFDPDVVATVEIDGIDTTPEGLSIRVRPIFGEDVA